MRTLSPSTTVSTRNPSHLISKSQSGSSNGAPTSVASIGEMKLGLARPVFLTIAHMMRRAVESYAAATFSCGRTRGPPPDGPLARSRRPLPLCGRLDGSLILHLGGLDHDRGQGRVRLCPSGADIRRERLADSRVVRLTDAISGMPTAKGLDRGHDLVELVETLHDDREGLHQDLA